MRCWEKNSNASAWNTIAGGTSSLAADSGGSNFRIATWAPTMKRARISLTSRLSILFTTGDEAGLASWENGSCNNHIFAGGRDVLETDLKPALVNHKPKIQPRFGLPFVPFSCVPFLLLCLSSDAGGTRRSPRWPCRAAPRRRAREWGN